MILLSGTLRTLCLQTMTHMGKHGARAGNRIEVNDYSESAQLVNSVAVISLISL